MNTIDNYNKYINRKRGNTFLAVLFILNSIILAIRGEPSLFIAAVFLVSSIASAYFTAMLWESY